MSLYYEAASFLSPASSKEGSLKSRIFKSNVGVKSNPATIYALLSETAKCDTLLKEVIDNAGILALEPKLTPTLSLLLVHDHLFAKKGIAAPTNHPLRLAVERHKARLQAELTKCRIRRNCASFEDLKRNLDERAKRAGAESPQPRWVRLNRVKCTLQQQMSGTFSGYTQTPRLIDVTKASPEEKLVYVDEHIPDLLALPRGTELTKTQAYKQGQLILQDKASCFPAFLLLDDLDTCSQGDILDACAAPGNKTTHLASILSQLSTAAGPAASTGNKLVNGIKNATSDVRIFACERDRHRALTLQKMVTLSGAENMVTVLARQDFLALDPANSRFENVTHLLLDPSCSGSGIVGRDEMLALQLPEDPKLPTANPTVMGGVARTKGVSKKRKRPNKPESDEKSGHQEEISTSGNSHPQSEEIIRDVDTTRLQKLANLQTRMIEHAFSFPAARRITYSTCSIHVQENEVVVSRALRTEVARQRAWRVLRLDEQPYGMKKWTHRGLNLSAAIAGDMDPSQKGAFHCLSEEERQACIRCHASDEEGTMGFFVCGFIREKDTAYSNGEAERGAPSHVKDEDWEGFSDDEVVQLVY